MSSGPATGHAPGTCWAVTVQGSSNIVIADTVINDITVYGYDQTVFFHNGEPVCGIAAANWA